MNPFDLRGPEFLVFYAIVTGCVVVAAVLVRRWMEAGLIPKLREVDPYVIATLRGGVDEAIRVAIVSLLDREAIRHDGEGNLAPGRIGPEHVRRPLEREILRVLAQPEPSARVLADYSVRMAATDLEEELVRQGLLPGPEVKRRRFLVGFTAAGFVWAIAIAKIVVATFRGRSNVEFLVHAAVIATFVLVLVLRHRRTSRGDRLVADLQTLFSRMKERKAELAAGGATNELALLAGIYGVAALQGTALAPALTLFPASAASSSSSSGGGSSSSCGSSCGGGGCGGGCGGCGS